MKTPPTVRGVARVSTIVLEGAGAAGFGEGGALSVIMRELRRQGARATVAGGTYGGTSAGGILAMLCAIGRVEALKDIMAATPWRSFMPRRFGFVRNAWSALTTGSYSDLGFAQKWIRQQLLDSGNPPDVTFGQLRRRHRATLKVVAVDEDRMVPFVFGPDTSPDVRVDLGVLATMAIPEVWPSVLIDGTPYSDGGTLANFPLRLIAGDLDAEEVVGIAIDYAGEGDVEPYRSNGWSRARRILKATREQRIHHPSHLYPARAVVVDRPTWAKATSFNLTAAQRAILWHNGEVAASKWLHHA